MVRSHPIAVRLEPELEKMVREQADFWHVSISQAIRNMVFEFFEKGEEPKITPGTDLEKTFTAWLNSPAGKEMLREQMRGLIK